MTQILSDKQLFLFHNCVGVKWSYGTVYTIPVLSFLLEL